MILLRVKLTRFAEFTICQYLRTPFIVAPRVCACIIATRMFVCKCTSCQYLRILFDFAHNDCACIVATRMLVCKCTSCQYLRTLFDFAHNDCACIVATRIFVCESLHIVHKLLRVHCCKALDRLFEHFLVMTIFVSAGKCASD